MAIALYLSAGELELAESWAEWQTKRNAERNLGDRLPAISPKTAEANEAQNAIAFGAEIGLARHLGLPWHPPDEQAGPDAPDIGDVIGVRWTRTRTLFVYRRDPANRCYWLVTGEPNPYTVHGWILGKRAKHERYWTVETVRYPCFAIPISELSEPW